MELPWVCESCGYENWIDLCNLTEWPLDKLLTAQGYVCENCGMREAISYTSASMQAAERKLDRYAPTHKKYGFHLAKCVTKQTGLNQRGEALWLERVSEPGYPLTDLPRSSDLTPSISIN